MAFLKTKSLWPLSLYLPQIDISQTGKAFAVSVLVLIPAVIVFWQGRIIWNKGSYPRQSRNRATETRGFIYEENKTDKNSGRIFCPDAFVYFSVQGGRFGECSTGRDKTAQNQVITHEVTGTGKVMGTRERAVFTQEGQKVEQVYVQEGQNVKKGMRC